MLSAVETINTILPPLATIIVGFLGLFFGLLPREHLGALNGIVNNFFLPALIFQGIASAKLSDIDPRFIAVWAIHKIGFLVLSFAGCAALVFFRRKWRVSTKAAAGGTRTTFMEEFLPLATISWFTITWTNTGVSLFVSEILYSTRGSFLIYLITIVETWIQFPIAGVLLKLSHRLQQSAELRSRDLVKSTSSIALSETLASGDEEPEDEVNVECGPEADCPRVSVDMSRPVLNHKVAEEPSKAPQESEALSYDNWALRRLRIFSAWLTKRPNLDLLIRTATDPCIVAAVLGSVYLFAGIPWPSCLDRTLIAIGRGYTGLSLIGLGAFAACNKGWFKGSALLTTGVFLFLHHLVSPVAMALLCYGLGVVGVEAQVSVLTAALPVATCVFTFCTDIRLYPETSLGCVVIGTILIAPVLIVLIPTFDALSLFHLLASSSSQ